MEFLRDLRFAARNARRSPAFAAAVAGTLALGIGASTAIWSLADAVLLAPQPFAEPERLISIWGEIPGRAPRVEVSWADFESWRERTTALSDLALVTSTVADSVLGASRGVAPTHVAGRVVTGNLFDLLGVRPALGRTLTEKDDLPGAEPVVVISDGLWRRRFGGDARVVGRQVRLDGEAATIVGVMPPEFDYPEGTEVWSSASWVRAQPEILGLRLFEAIGRIRPGVSFAAARADLQRASAAIARANPRLEGYRANPRRLNEEILGDARPALHLLLLASALLLSIGCANVAGLWLARAAGRRRETAIRRALGAGRRRLAREALAESVLAAGAATLLGLLLARWGIAGVAHLAPSDLPALHALALDGRAVLFASAVALVSALVAGTAPLATALSGGLSTRLNEGLRAAASRGLVRWRSVLVVGEVALTLVLLVASALLARSLAALEGTDLGFAPQRLLAVRVQFASPLYPDEASRGAFFARAVEKVQNLPGVERAAGVLLRPLAGPIGWDYSFAVEGESAAEQRAKPAANHERVSPGYFAALGIPFVGGRDFAWSDDAATPRVAIVSETAARRYFPGGQAIGRRFRWLAGPSEWITVVGVVGDVRYREREAVRPDIYVPFLQDPFWATDLMLRTTGDPLDLVPSVRSAIAALDPELPIFRVQAMNDAVAESVARPRLRTLLLALFGALAVVLSGVGLGALLSFLVAERRRELAVRLALGAERRQLLLLVVGRGLALAAAGLAFGLLGALALAASGTLDGLLFGLEAADSGTYFGVSLFLLLVALAASVIPAGRATEVEPIVALREG